MYDIIRYCSGGWVFRVSKKNKQGEPICARTIRPTEPEVPFLKDRCTFPRFHFVSDQELLEIVINSKDIELVSFVSLTVHQWVGYLGFREGDAVRG
jgi:hypothetical protein